MAEFQFRTGAKSKKRKSSEPQAALAKMMKQLPGSESTAQLQSQEDSCKKVKSANAEVLNLKKLTQAVEQAMDTSEKQVKIEIPDTINIMRFAEARASEIATIMQEIKLKGSKSTSQQVPHHMRRRAASHNSNRVPRRLRERAKHEIVKAKKVKRPSRRHRRRPSNLLLDYIRRQRKNIWMETHIWFKKRFKVVKLWGYQIPLHPNDKNRRSAHKSVTQYSSLMDISYMCCIQLEGQENDLLSKLKAITSNSAGFTFASRVHLQGRREGRTTIYHPQSFPYRALGPVSFLWQPPQTSQVSGDMQQRKLWIWCHPSMYEEVKNLLFVIFDMKKPEEITEEINVHSVDEDAENKACHPKMDDNVQKVEEVKAQNDVAVLEQSDDFDDDRSLCEKKEELMEELKAHNGVAVLEQQADGHDQGLCDEKEELTENAESGVEVLSEVIDTIEVVDSLKEKVISDLKNDSSKVITENSPVVDQVNSESENLIEIIDISSDTEMPLVHEKPSTDEYEQRNGSEAMMSSTDHIKQSLDASMNIEDITPKTVDSAIPLKAGKKCKKTDAVMKSKAPKNSRKGMKGKTSKKNLKKQPANTPLQFDVLDPKLVARIKTPKSFSNEGITMTLLKDHMVRHRLIGPKSLSVLNNVLKSAEVPSSTKSGSDSKWWEEYYNDENHVTVHNQQKQLWSIFQSCRYIPTGMIFGLTVGDPRIDIPQKKGANFKDNGSELNISKVHLENAVPDNVSSSPLWDWKIHEKVTASKQKDGELNKKRSKLLIPGSRLELGREECRVPVLLIHQSGNECDYGWDIIIPVGWSMAFWIAFIYNGARAHGLRELKSIHNNGGLPLFPFSFPDTPSGQNQEESNRLEKLAKHFRRPSAKRTSFGKLGISTPFFIPWKVLVDDWQDELVSSKVLVSAAASIENSVNEHDYFVLRNRIVIEKLKKMCLHLSKYSYSKSGDNLKQSRLIEETIAYLESLYNTDMLRSLVCVRVECLNRGKSCEDSELYLPEENDLLSIRSDSSYGGPIEPIHSIEKLPNIQKSKNHKRKKGNCSVNKVKPKPKVQELTELDKPKRPNCSTLIKNCSRKRMGYLSSGGFSFTTGHGGGVGHCSYVSVIEMLKLCYRMKSLPIVLVRQQNSFQYRLASINIVDSFI